MLGAVAALITAVVAFVNLPSGTLLTILKVILYFVVLGLLSVIVAILVDLPKDPKDSSGNPGCGVLLFGSLLLLVIGYGILILIKLIFP